MKSFFISLSALWRAEGVCVYQVELNIGLSQLFSASGQTRTVFPCLCISTDIFWYVGYTENENLQIRANGYNRGGIILRGENGYLIPDS